MDDLETFFSGEKVPLSLLTPSWYGTELQAATLSPKALHDIDYHLEALETNLKLRAYCEQIIANAEQNKWLVALLELEVASGGKARSIYGLTPKHVEMILEYEADGLDIAPIIIDEFKAIQFFDAEGKKYWTTGVKAHSECKRFLSKRWLLLNQLRDQQIAASIDAEELQMERRGLERKGLDDVLEEWLKALTALLTYEVTKYVRIRLRKQALTEHDVQESERSLEEIRRCIEANDGRWAWHWIARRANVPSRLRALRGYNEVNTLVDLMTSMHEEDKRHIPTSESKTL